MLETRHLTKRYGPQLAVEDVSFSLKTGEITGFLGPNGAGKTSTLRMIAGYLEPTSGQIIVDGMDLGEKPTQCKERFGYMPESAPLYMDMRVAEYLGFRAELKGIRKKQAKHTAIERALHQAQVTEVANRIIGQLSKGTRHRVALADALIADPPLLLLDEPTAGLDPNQIRQFRDLIKNFAGSKTILISTHILSEVEAMCGRVIILDRGKVVLDDDVSALQSKDRDVIEIQADAEVDVLRSVIGNATIRHESTEEQAQGGVTSRIEFTADDLDAALKDTLPRLAARNLVVRRFGIVRSRLEDVFAKLTTHPESLEPSANVDSDQTSEPKVESDSKEAT